MLNSIHTALVAGAFTIVGGLIGIVGQWITTQASLKSKKMELFFARKADSYQPALLRRNLFLARIGSAGQRPV
jgi:hypothetical protein